MIFILLAILIGAACAWLCAYIAEQKGLRVGFWAVLGFLFGVFALLAMIAVPADDAGKYRRWLNKSTTEELIGSYRYYPSVEAQTELERRGVNLPQYGLQPVR
jgi:hypothetical protein